MKSTAKTVAGACALAIEQTRAIATEWATTTDIYATVVAGDCMEPGVPNGTCIGVDPLGVLRSGDLIVIVKKPEFIREGEPPAALKRLVGAVDRSRIPFVRRHKDEVDPCLLVEMDNPRKRLLIPCSTIAAVHRCLGVAKRSRDGRTAHLGNHESEARL